jgi:hypothetical protein
MIIGNGRNGDDYYHEDEEAGAVGGEQVNRFDDGNGNGNGQSEYKSTSDKKGGGNWPTLSKDTPFMATSATPSSNAATAAAAASKATWMPAIPKNSRNRNSNNISHDQNKPNISSNNKSLSPSESAAWMLATAARTPLYNDMELNAAARAPLYGYTERHADPSPSSASFVALPSQARLPSKLYRQIMQQNKTALTPTLSANLSNQGVQMAAALSSTHKESGKDKDSSLRVAYISSFLAATYGVTNRNGRGLRHWCG